VSRAKVYIVGAGPGAPDLITLRGARAIAAADVVVWARSLVMEEAVSEHVRAGAEVIESSSLTLEQVLAIYDRAKAEDLVVARVHSGDPSIYGAVQEQLRELEGRGLPYEIVPGVTSVSATAAALGRELTVPETSQSLILTRRGGRTPMPPRERVEEFARHGTTMALFLSIARPHELQRELLEGGYPPDTPCVIAYRVSWPDERLLGCRLDELGDRVRQARLNRQALVLVGPGLLDAGTRSHLYDPDYGHRFRRLGRARGPRPAAAGPSDRAAS
jgi:precorrin-4/cobalt-precorrin-4 C11-methyltransferase